ncbi:MAG: ribosome assembly factor SBDS [Nanoarchaeota archaeon]|nr:ribosome assembly factor SBDS [Nanoarchaeota archaeon]
MVDVDKAVKASIKKEGKNFEILVDAEKAQDYRKGKPISIRDVVAVDNVFSDVKKGTAASEHDLERLFGTKDLEKLFSLIVKEGDVQFTTKQLAALREEKRKQLITMIHRHAVDSKTGIPHPPARIEAAFEEAKIKIEENKTADQQLEAVVKQLRIILPIKFETRQIEVIIPPEYSSACFPILKKYKTVQEDWLGDGSLRAVVELPAGLTDELFSVLNKAAHGQIESKILKTF